MTALRNRVGGPVTRLIVTRVLLGVMTLFLVSILVFLATEALPGNAAIAKLGRGATPQVIAAFKARYHLNEPIFSQYFHWLGDLLHGNLGDSLISGSSVTSIIRQRIGNSALLMLFAAVVGIPLGIAIGVLSAMRRGKVFDHVSSVVLLGLASVPEFVMAILFVVLFATTVLHLLPAVSTLSPTESVFSQLKLLVLPALTLAALIVPYIARIVRASMIEVLESDYVALARLNGIPERQVVVRHALPSAAGPLCQALAISLSYLAGGVVVVETVFGFPGIGQALVQAVQDRDIAVIQALVLLVAVVYIVLNIAADVATLMLTPRLRVEGH